MKAPRVHASDRLFVAFLFMFAVFLVALFVAVGFALFRGAWPTLIANPVAHLAGERWVPAQGWFGVAYFLYGTLISSFVGMVFASVVGVGTALLLTQFAHTFAVKAIRALIDVMSVIPSVVYGVWGLFALAPWLRFMPAGLMAAGLILGVMVLPTLIVTVGKMMDSVPQELVDGALALGATRTEKVRIIILPYARIGIIGAIFLCFGRALGEAVAVALVIGSAHGASRSWFAPGNTLASLIAKQFFSADTPLLRSSLYEVGLLLAFVYTVFYIASKLLVWRVSRRVGAV